MVAAGRPGHAAGRSRRRPGPAGRGASGFPRGLNAIRHPRPATWPGWPSRAAARHAGRSRRPAAGGCILAGPGKPAVRQSPDPAASAYSKVWLQCCHAKLLPSGTVRFSPSIQIPLGQALHARISEMQRALRGDQAAGRPRLSSATVWAATGGSRSARRPATGRLDLGRPGRRRAAPIAAARSGPATISTGRSGGPRRSAPGPKAAARDCRAGSPDPGGAGRGQPPSSWRRRRARRRQHLAVNSFFSGPPSAIRTSGRLESSSGPVPRSFRTKQVAVTPCLASATTRPVTAAGPSGRSRGANRSRRAAGQITSATPIARSVRPPPGPVQGTRAVEPTPNHSWAGLSRVNVCSATSTSGCRAAGRPPTGRSGRPAGRRGRWRGT